jgi:hypothetical protein
MVGTLPVQGPGTELINFAAASVNLMSGTGPPENFHF